MADAFFSGIRPRTDPQGLTLCTILRYPFLAGRPFNFSKAPIYIIFKAGACAKKKHYFFLKIFQKVPKNVFFFQKLACGAENLVKMG